MLRFKWLRLDQGSNVFFLVLYKMLHDNKPIQIKPHSACSFTMSHLASSGTHGGFFTNSFCETKCYNIILFPFISFCISQYFQRSQIQQTEKAWDRDNIFIFCNGADFVQCTTSYQIFILYFRSEYEFERLRLIVDILPSSHQGACLHVVTVNFILMLVEVSDIQYVLDSVYRL